MAQIAPIPSTQGHMFVSYAHVDYERILPEIEWLESQRYSVWHDIEIRPGTAWADELAAAIDNSNFVLFFVSEQSIASQHCLNEIAYALDAKKPVLAVYLESVELRGGLRLAMSRTQALLHWQLKQSEFRAQIREAIENLFRGLGDASSRASAAAHITPPLRKRIWHVPLQRNLHFAGRDQDIDEIASAFRHSPKPLILALTGLGGVGKSQLALEYLYRHTKEIPLVAWIRAENAATMETDFVALANDLGLREAGDPDIRLVIAAVHEWLESNDKWVLTLDNVANPSVLRKYLPRELRGHVLLTTRHQGWGSHARTKAIIPFGHAEASAFIMDRTGDQDAESAATLATVLDGLPLALEEAAAYMETTGRSIASYLDLFQSYRDKLLARSKPTTDYPATLRTTWEMCFQELEDAEPGAADLLNLLAFLSPDDIPKSILSHHGNDERQDIPQELLIDEMVAALRRYSLIKVDNDAASVHRLVQMVTRDRQSTEQRRKNALTALEVIERHFPMSGAVGDSLPDCARLLPHALSILKHVGTSEEAELCAGKLLARTGTYLCARGSTADGISQLKRTYEIFRRHDDHSQDYAHACELYGRACYQCGELKAARSLVQNAVDVLDFIGEPSVSRYSRCLTVLAWICWTDGDDEAARQSAERCAALVGASNTIADPRLLGGLAILSRILLDQGKMGESIETMEACVASIETLGGARHPLMCGAFMHLAQVLLDAGMPLRAKSWAQEALALGGPAYGEHHPLVSSTHCVMGQVLSQLGDHESAYYEFEAAMESVRHSETTESQVSVVSGACLVRTLIALGRGPEATELLDEYMHLVNSKICGDSELARFHSFFAAAALDRLAGHFDLCLEKCREADAIISSRYGESHIYRVPTLIEQGQALASIATNADAEKPVRKALQILEVNSLRSHPKFADGLLALADIMDTADDSGDAPRLRSEALEILKVTTGPSSLVTIALENQLVDA